jgi:hypothetical protein
VDARPAAQSAGRNDKQSLFDICFNLEVYFHGGVSFDPYREQYKKIPRNEFQYYEIYNASEGFCHSGFEQLE